MSIDTTSKNSLDRIDELVRSYNTTALCRFNAAERLTRKGRWSFLTVSLSSLLLIFIPLLQMSGTYVSGDSKLAGTLQVFLAVVSLVYSSLIYKSEYEARAVKHAQAAAKFKDYSRRLLLIKDGESKEQISEIEKKYHKVVQFSEDHSRVDYHRTRAMLRTYYQEGKLYRYFAIAKYKLDIMLYPLIFSVTQFAFFVIVVKWKAIVNALIV